MGVIVLLMAWLAPPATSMPARSNHHNDGALRLAAKLIPIPFLERWMQIIVAQQRGALNRDP
jgi:hypothetical protein